MNEKTTIWSALAILAAIAVLVSACAAPTEVVETAEEVTAAPTEVVETVEEVTAAPTEVVETVEEEVTATPPPVEEARPLIIAVAADADALDPQLHNALSSRMVYSNIFDNLVLRDAEGNPNEGLALSWTPISDTVWEIKLREGVTFHNGEPFTGEDVKFWFDRMLDPETEMQSFFRSRFELVSGVEVVDDHTVHINTKEPFPILPSRLTEVYIVPHEYFEEVGDEGFSKNPIGTGAYQFVEWVRDDHITLEANDDYWGGAPSIKDVTFRVVPEPSTRVSELLAGSADIVQTVPVGSGEKIEDEEGMSLYAVPSGRIAFLQMDMRDPSLPFYDVRVRRAMNYAVNPQEIIDEILDGHAKIVGARASVYDFGYDPTIKPYPYDPDRARELLAEAGYPDGFETLCWATSGRYLMDTEIMQAVAAQLAEVGIQLDLQFLEFSAYLEKANSQNLSPLTFAAMATGTFDVFQFLAYNRTGDVLGYVEDPEYDARLDEAASTLDPDARVEIYRELLQWEHDEAFFVTLFQYESLFGVSDDVYFIPRADELILVSDVSWR
jgi:peptide/nickel transport system substrate-binding protein